jgi:hypothetical protein
VVGSVYNIEELEVVEEVVEIGKKALIYRI